MSWVECIEPGAQGERMKSYVDNIRVNLWSYDLLQQWNNQINIPTVPET